MYNEIKPSKELSKSIDSFWTFSCNKMSENFKILPDSCADLIFDLHENKAFISGIMTKYQVQNSLSNSNLIGIRFEIEKFGLLTQTPLLETKNLRIDLSDIIPFHQSYMVEQLNEIASPIDKVLFLENFISKTINQLNKKEDYLILAITKCIRNSNGQVNIKSLANNHFISLRQLERRFKNYTGLTVKEFSRIVRFHEAKKVISNSAEKSLLEIAFNVGFFDHSHMTNEFNRVSGENPSFFR